MNEADERNGTVARVVADAKRGNRETFHYLYVHYADNVYGFVNSIVRDEHQAEAEDDDGRIQRGRRY